MEAQAKFAFAASQEDELSFEKGSILNVRTGNVGCRFFSGNLQASCIN